jgi:hypothetical protein
MNSFNSITKMIERYVISERLKKSRQPIQRWRRTGNLFCCCWRCVQSDLLLVLLLLLKAGDPPPGQA